MVRALGLAAITGTRALGGKVWQRGFKNWGSPTERGAVALAWGSSAWLCP